MFRDAPIDGVIIKQILRYEDHRGWLIELFRQDELEQQHWPQMAYVSHTLPGVTRGPHEHDEQSDQFAFIGPGDLQLYLWDARRASRTHGHRHKLIVGAANPAVVIIPPGVVHAYRNISDHPACVVNLPNRLYAGPGRRQPVDEIRYEDRDDHPYLLD